jgi:hypothetical protein
MYFLPVLSCKNCPQPISLPLPTQDEKSPRRIAWPWGDFSGNFLCSSCSHLNAYLAQDCRWFPVESMAPSQKTKGMAVHQICIPCGTAPCAGLLHILAVMPKESRVEDVARTLATVERNGISCDKGHPNYGRTVPTSVQTTGISVTLVTDSWDG